MLQIKVPFLFSALIFHLVHFDIQNHKVSAAPFGFLVKGEMCLERCRVRHGYFEDTTDQDSAKLVSTGKVFLNFKCTCMVSGDFRRFLIHIFGKGPANKYRFWHHVGRGRAERAKMQGKINFLSAKDYDEAMAELESQQKDGQKPDHYEDNQTNHEQGDGQYPQNEDQYAENEEEQEENKHGQNMGQHGQNKGQHGQNVAYYGHSESPSASRRGNLSPYRDQDEYESPPPSPYRGSHQTSKSLSSGSHQTPTSPPRGAYQKGSMSPSPPRGVYQKGSMSPSPPRGAYQKGSMSPSPPRGAYQKGSMSPSRSSYHLTPTSPSGGAYGAMNPYRGSYQDASDNEMGECKNGVCRRPK